MKGSRKKESAKPPTGGLVDELLKKLRARIVELQREEKLLTAAGCIRAFVHFKTGTQKMYLLSPTENGKREFTYVGVDPKKQAKARAEIARYGERKLLQGKIQNLENDAQRLADDLEELLENVEGAIEGDGESRMLGRRYGTARW